MAQHRTFSAELQDFRRDFFDKKVWMINVDGLATTASDGRTTGFSVGFPALALTGFLADKETLAKRIAETLSQHLNPDPNDLSAAIADIEREVPGAYWLLAHGRTRSDEPPYGARILFGSDEVIGEGEGASPAAAVRAALASIRPTAAGAMEASQ
jgi:phenylpyruvate tautomerase PptA (4-oxalocrotonate tautomerase family)